MGGTSPLHIYTLKQMHLAYSSLFFYHKNVPNQITIKYKAMSSGLHSTKKTTDILPCGISLCGTNKGILILMEITATLLSKIVMSLYQAPLLSCGVFVYY